ncbi:MAG: hypothetical protein WDA27_04890 [Actinomycetota bacterium]
MIEQESHIDLSNCPGMGTVGKVLVSVLAATCASVLPGRASPSLVAEASGEIVFIGSSRGQDFWERVSGIIDFGPAAVVDSGGVLDASTGSGCLHVGTSFWNTVRLCAPFEPGEVTLILNSFEQGAGLLVVNTLGRASGRAFAMVPLADESPPWITPLTPLFWIPWVDDEVSADEVRASVREHQADFFDVETGYVRVGDEEAVLVDGSGIVVTDARIAGAIAG